MLLPVDEPKSAEITASTKKDAIDTPLVETVKNAEVAELDGKFVEAAVKADELKAINTNSTSNDVNKTTTTVTVNVTQTKVTVGGDVVDKGQGISEVVSTVSSIAEAAVGAIEHELKKPTETAEANSIDDVADIEMADADAIADCEMKDVSLVEEQPEVVTSTAATTGTKTVEADSVNSSSSSNSNTVRAESTASTAAAAVAATNEAEQKIDDVEKNISNLFNGGDDNIVSTNDKSNEDLSNADNSSTQVASSQSDNNLLNNGTESKAKETQLRHDAIKDNNDLVSILAGSDKPEENISSSSAQKPQTSEKDVKSIQSTKSQITSSSNKSTSPTTTTTTQKQSDISSEKVSTATDQKASANEAEKGLGGKASRQEIISSLSSTVKEDQLSSTVSGWFH